MAWVIDSRRSVRGRPLPAGSPAPGFPFAVAILALAAVSLVIAGAFALAGAWLVLPFAGLELAGLGWALRHAGSRGPAGVPPAPTLACASRMAASRDRHVPVTLIPMLNKRRKSF